MTASMCCTPIISSLEEKKKETGTLLSNFYRVMLLRSSPYLSWMLLAKASASTPDMNSGTEAILQICSVAIILKEAKGESATTYLTCFITDSSLYSWIARRHATAPMDRPQSTILLKPRCTNALNISTELFDYYPVPATRAARRSRRAPGFCRDCVSRRDRGKRS